MTHFFYEEEVNARAALEKFVSRRIFSAALPFFQRHLQYIKFLFLSYVQIPVFHGTWHGQLRVATSHPW